MWSSKRRLRAPVFADHALRAVFIVDAWGIARRPGLTMIVARAFSRRPVAKLRLGAAPRKRRASSLDATRTFPVGTAQPRPAREGHYTIFRKSPENLQPDSASNSAPPQASRRLCG